jgi:dephospho-CoA kinase
VAVRRVAITGGIGSGKSTVCRALAAVGGAPIYDSDRMAKDIMNANEAVVREITALFGPEAYTAEGLNRPLIASVAFGNPAVLEQLNAIVHPRVVADFEEWAEAQQSDYVILESALLFTSPLVGHYDLSVVVDAPLEMRIERCVRRDGASREQVASRIARQMPAEQMRLRGDIVVEADGRDLRPIVEEIDHKIRTL